MKYILVLLFAFLVGCSGNSSDAPQPVDSTATTASSAPSKPSHNVYQAPIVYAVVNYITENGEPHVEIKDQDGTEYFDEGDASCDAYCQYDKYYKRWFQDTGVVEYKMRGSVRYIVQACTRCTHITP